MDEHGHIVTLKCSLLALGFEFVLWMTRVRTAAQRPCAVMDGCIKLSNVLQAGQPSKRKSTAASKVRSDIFSPLSFESASSSDDSGCLDSQIRADGVG